MTHDEMMSLLANTLADAAGHAGCLPILDCFSPHPGEEVTVSIPMCDDTVDIVLEDLDFPHEWEELLENSGADTMGDLVDYLCYCSQNNISLAISPEDEEKLYAPHYMEKLPAGKYTLTEVTAPDGYAIAERMEFEVLPNGEVQTFEMFDDTIKVKISKVDITTNEELPGAELVIKDKDGTEIDRWISTNGPHYVEKMPAGDYTLTEITAPNGYKVAESIDFTVLPTGEMQTVVMKDAREDTPTPTPDNTPTPDHTPQPTPNTTPAPTPMPAAPTATPTPLLTIPKTGDNSPLGLLLAIAGISLAGLAVLVHKSARRKDIAPRDDDDEDTED